MILGLVGIPLSAQAQSTGFPSVDTAFASTGPYAVTVAREANHTYFSPADLGPNGLKHPVVIWGNGTFNSPRNYDTFLRHLASHGFIVAAANTSNAGNGREMLAGIDQLTAKNGRSGDRFFDKVDLTRIAAMGYSQGGGGAMTAALDPRVTTTVAIQPWQGSTAGIRVPTLYLAGSSDTIVRSRTVEGHFDASSSVPAAYGNLRGATHFEVMGDGGGFRGPATAWLRYFLMGDSNARGTFVDASCTLCTSTSWSPYRANALMTTVMPIGAPVTTSTTAAPTTTVAPTTTTTAPARRCGWYWFRYVCR